MAFNGFYCPCLDYAISDSMVVDKEMEETLKIKSPNLPHTVSGLADDIKVVKRDVIMKEMVTSTV
jgi:hypothetical protein